MLIVYTKSLQALVMSAFASFYSTPSLTRSLLLVHFSSLMCTDPIPARPHQRLYYHSIFNIQHHDPQYYIFLPLIHQRFSSQFCKTTYSSSARYNMRLSLYLCLSSFTV